MELRELESREELKRDGMILKQITEKIVAASKKKSFQKEIDDTYNENITQVYLNLVPELEDSSEIEGARKLLNKLLVR